MISSFCILLVFIPGLAANAEDRLFDKLFIENGYNAKSRPVEQTSQSVNVSFRYDFVVLYEVNEKSQTICILSQLYQVWRDYRLFWNSSEYDDLVSLSIDSHMLWIPDTTLFNTVEVSRPNTEDSQKARVTIDPETQTGIVSYNFNTRHTVGCLMDMTYFPFDTQNCTFAFTSWTYDITQLNYTLVSEVVTQEVFQPSDVWSVLSFNLTTQNFTFECCPKPFLTIYAHLIIKRRALYYVFNLIIPTTMINILSSFSLFASRGTPDNMNDKLQIGITTVLAYCVLLMSVSDQLPKGSTAVPLLGIFYVVVMVQNTVELFVAVSLCDPARKLKILAAYHRVCKRHNNKATEVQPKTGTVVEENGVKTEVISCPGDDMGDQWDDGRLENCCMIISMCFTE